MVQGGAAQNGGTRRTTAIFLLVLFYSSILCYVTFLLLWAPPVQREDATASMFSEDRAFVHIRALSEDIVSRQVSTNGLHEATDYIVHQCEQLIQEANRTDWIAGQVEVEWVTGAINMEFFHRKFTNAYSHIPNIIFVLTPKGTERQKAIMLVAHYDAPNCSPGASDDASGVAVLLEAARAMVHNPNHPPQTPVVFLFTGAEETLMQAAHGFISQSPWASRVGAFINLESTGPGGLPVVFQSTGAWTVEAYARGAPHPRGSSLARDVFEAGIIPADTDFKMLSSQHYGTLPGLDVAHILDAAAYHTSLDTADRIKRGSVQELGEAALGATYEMSASLAKGATQGSQRPIFFDLGCRYMVVYSQSTALLLHSLPLLLCVLMPLLIPEGGVLAKYYSAMKYASVALMCLVTTIALPIVAAVVLVSLTGKPIMWFSHPALGVLTYLPIAILGALRPWWLPRPQSAGSSGKAAAAKPVLQSALPLAPLVGVTITISMVSAALTQLGLGLSFVPAFWAWSSVASTLLLPLVSSSIVASTVLVLLLGAVPAMLNSTMHTALLWHMMSKVTMLGADSAVKGDAVVAALCGMLVVGASGVYLAAVAAYCTRHVRTPVTLLLLSTSLAAAGACHLLAPHPYTTSMPKKLLLQHLITPTDPTPLSADSDMSSLPLEAHWAVAEIDPWPVGLHPSPPLPARPVAPQLAGVAMLLLYPLPSDLVSIRLLKAQLPQEPLVARPPSLKLQRHDYTDRSSVEVQLVSELPCWATLNITTTALLTNWTLTPDVPSPSISNQGGNTYIVRFASAKADPPWSFSLETAPGASLTATLAVAYLNATEPVQHMLQRWRPLYVPSLASTTYVTHWSLA